MASPEILSRAALSYGFDVETLSFISNSTNEVYQFTKKDLPYILRLSERPLDYVNNIKAEVQWVRYLAENGVRASLPITTTAGEIIAVFKEGDKWIIATAFEMAQGIFFDTDPKLWRHSLFNKWGETMGKIHSLTKTYDPGDPSLTRPEWSAAKIDNPYLEKGKYRVLLDRLKKLEGHISSFPKDEHSHGLIHYDFHPYNFLIDKGEHITVFDFDDAIFGWFALDIAVAATHAVWWGSPSNDRESKNDFAKMFLNEFLIGYLKHNHLDRFWVQHIPLFMDYRNISSFFRWLSSWDGNEERLSESQKSAIVYAVELIQQDLPYDGCDIQLDGELFI
ncbi:phosphotransferase enzyme family protein [Paenibacillus thermotolerans]|uniref:phosphotransferase enzyme family protein n=1 Tax=Paenibacillus thermotolerans TaxID=3027807 RepID=UPI00236782B1|nr:MULTISPECIES: phosphotransferase [unclassified Paenibacillus]